MLLSLSILHRHGARRPSPSELSHWSESAEVRTQWPVNELGSLTELGRRMGEELGAWFASVAVRSIGADKMKQSGACWRSSSSKRGRESGQNFVDGFNKYFDSYEVGADCDDGSKTKVPIDSSSKLLTVPEEYPGAQDLYFRPWLHLKSELEAINASTRASSAHLAVVNDNQQFLELMGEASKLKPLSAASSPQAQLEHLLWETSHVFAALKCEAFWASALAHGICNSHNRLSPSLSSTSLASSSSSSLTSSPLPSPIVTAHKSSSSFESSIQNNQTTPVPSATNHIFSDKRNLLTEQIVTGVTDFSSFESKLEDLACYVWKCRHLSHALVPSVGKLTVKHFLGDILDGHKAVNVFSGHDYTIMVLLSAWGLLRQLKQHLGFCSFVTFELWAASSAEELPEFSVSGYDCMPNSSDLESVPSSRFLRVCINWFPFTPDNPTKVDCSKFEVLAVLPEELIRKTIDELNGDLGSF